LKELDTALCSRLAQALFIQEEVDAEISFFNIGRIRNSELSDT